MDVALKQRLVGASVIIALAIIFIPMIFDDSNRKQNQSISIAIPDEPSDLKHKLLTIDSHTHGTENNETIKNDSDIKATENSAPIQKQESIIELVDNSKTNTQAIEKTKTIKQQKSEPKDKKEAVIIDKQKQTTSKDNSTSDTQGIYRIKLGSFSLQKNAQQLKAKIINSGYDAVVEKDFNSGLYKVSSKLFDSFKAAKAYDSKLQKLNLKTGKTSIEKLDEKAQLDAEIQLDTGWILQIGIFSNKDNSLKLRDKIRKKGYITFVDEIKNSQKKIRYRVRIGPYATREEAIGKQKSVLKTMKLEALVKPHEKQKVVN